MSSPAPQLPKPDVTAGTTQEVLVFAQTLADREIASIERLHARTLKYISYIAIAFAVVGSMLGWLGFSSLKSIAIETAKQQVSAETAKQVQEKLTRKNLNQIVQTQVNEFVRNQLTSEVRKQIAVGSLHDQILNTAREQSLRQVSGALAPRHLTVQQQSALRDALSRLGTC